MHIKHTLCGLFLQLAKCIHTRARARTSIFATYIHMCTYNHTYVCIYIYICTRMYTYLTHMRARTNSHIRSTHSDIMYVIHFIFDTQIS